MIARKHLFYLKNRKDAFFVDKMHKNTPAITCEFSQNF